MYKIKLKVYDFQLNLDELENPTMSHWNLTDTKVVVEAKKYDCCPDELYQSITYFFTMKRSSSAVAIVTPLAGK